MTIYVSFGALVLHLHGNERLEDKNFKIFNLFLKKTGGTDPANSRSVFTEVVVAVENIVQTDLFLYDIDFVHGSMIGELAKRCLAKYSNTARLSRYNSHNRYISKINALFRAYRCQSSDEFIKRPSNPERHLTTCKERVKHAFPTKVYQLRETLSDNLGSFIISYSDDQKLLKNMALIDFESICVQVDKCCDTDTTIWIGKHVPLSASISFILIDQSTLWCNSNPGALVESFVDALDRLAIQSKAEMELKFVEIDTSVNSFNFSPILINVAVATNRY